ncbi:MAG: membrane protein insertion efficiency factor YidD [Rhizobacter sp.]|nr:membrane protein insertion efficiency factor YidD [Chlorobiales bacterium]
MKEKIRRATNALPVLLIKIYRAAVSPHLPPSCRFEPSCSQYGLEAFQTHSLFKALGLTVWRIVRCNPFVAGGYDPVPPAVSTARQRSTIQSTTHEIVSHTPCTHHASGGAD